MPGRFRRLRHPADVRRRHDRDPDHDPENDRDRDVEGIVEKAALRPARRAAEPESTSRATIALASIALSPVLATTLPALDAPRRCLPVSHRLDCTRLDRSRPEMVRSAAW